MNKKLNYNWKRFWCPPEESINLSDDEFLSDPDSEFGKIINPWTVSFKSISHIPCLVLIGEPGIGKSTELVKQYKILKDELKDKKDDMLWGNLGDYQTESFLIQELFTTNKIFQSWRSKDHKLTLFLDSFDEGLSTIPTLSPLIINHLKKYDINRLFLRIVCRSAELPEFLIDGLERIWGEGNFQIFELAPLRRVDVEEAASSNDIDPHSFIDKIFMKEIIPFAIKPITLEFIIHSFKENGNLPSSKIELYLDGCRQLCLEVNTSRISSKRVGLLDSDQLLKVASRIAAISIICNKPVININEKMKKLPKSEVPIQSLKGGKEIVNDNEFNIDEKVIMETLGTGLFSSRGIDRLGWAHQSYAEFLSALYISQNDIHIHQVKSLLVHPYDPEGKLIPQLHETANWLSGMELDIFKMLLEIEPELLLQSNVKIKDNDILKTLVDRLLSLYDSGKLIDIDLQFKRRFSNLTHPGLERQLRPFICDNSKNAEVRRLSAYLIETCKLSGLLDDLIQVILDRNEPIYLRETYARVVKNIGESENKAKLKPLALSQCGDDPEDELKGIGLSAIWPDHLTPKELFSVITPPKNPNLFGSYLYFLRYDLLNNIDETNLPEALKWIEKQPPSFKQSYPYVIRECINKIMILSWKHLNNDTILKVFSKIAFNWLKQFRDIIEDDEDFNFSKSLENEDQKRRQLIISIIDLSRDINNKIDPICFSLKKIVFDKDISFLIDLFNKEQSRRIQKILARLIKITTNWNNPNQNEIILTLYRNNEIIQEEFASQLAPVELDSVEAVKSKEMYNDEKKWKEKTQHPPVLEPSIQQRVQDLLSKSVPDGENSWLSLTRILEITEYGNVFN